MTTYTLNGFANYYDNTLEQDVGADFSGITLEIVVPETTNSLSYTVLPLAPGDSAPDDLYVDVDVNDYTVRLNGETLNNSNQFDESIFRVNWTDGGGVAHNSIVFIAEILDATIPGFGLVDANYVFAIGGVALPTFSTNAQLVNFLDNQLNSLTIPGGSYAPNVNIPLSSLGATVTENDIITGNGAANKFDGGLGSDKISGLGGNDVLSGGRGNDTLKGGNGADRMHGNTKNDRLYGDGGNDTLNGDSGNDKLYGGTGNDKLIGGAGMDVLNGGKGNDVLIGRSGPDVFVFQNKSGRDQILDFNATNDLEDINLKAVANITGFVDLKNNHMSQVGNDVVIDDGAGTEITLQNVALSDLGKADFIF
ncbi:MAG: Ca2+-binding RTX toxin-like protein [Paracoccaceae bacterium]|jgi:Ca2+-binding RTX toxin-like protein